MKCGSVVRTMERGLYFSKWLHVSTFWPTLYKFEQLCLSRQTGKPTDPVAIQVFVDSFARVVSRALDNATTRAGGFPRNFSRAKESRKLGRGGLPVGVKCVYIMYYLSMCVRVVGTRRYYVVCNVHPAQNRLQFYHLDS